jgi:IS5 family transposase
MQQTLTGLENYSKTTRRVQFLVEMHRVAPWDVLCAVIESFHLKASAESGRPPLPLKRMLRRYFLQQWFDLSVPAVEQALYASAAMRGLSGIDPGCEATPDKTTACKFRRRLERHILCKQLLKTAGEHIKRNEIKISNDPVVNAMIISAPMSTKNRDS